MPCVRRMNIRIVLGTPSRRAAGGRAAHDRFKSRRSQIVTVLHFFNVLNEPLGRSSSTPPSDPRKAAQSPNNSGSKVVLQTDQSALP
jgi:hypothetical protein